MVFCNGSEALHVLLTFVNIYVLPMEIQLSRREDWDPLMDLTLPHFVPVGSQVLYFQRHISFLCSVSSVKMKGHCSFCRYL